MKLNSKYHYGVFILLGLVYALCQTRNAMIDSWYYASCVKYSSELFNSHHLLYNYIGLYWFYLLRLINPSLEAIVALNLLNAFSAFACLCVLYHCLKSMKNDSAVSFWLTVFCGVTFGFMRYATDAETYILPLLLSLISTSFFINPESKIRWQGSGFFAAIAILVHQLHLWWLIAMFLFILTSKPFRLRTVLLFCLPLLLIPVIYYLAYLLTGSQSMTLIAFITGEYSKGNASIDVSVYAFLLTIINLIRTFIQIHGQIVFLFKEYFYSGLLIIFICSGLLLYGYFRQGLKLKMVRKNNENQYSRLFLTAFILHLLFAFLSSGNAEFMVMLPFLMVLYLGSKYQFNNIQLVKYIAVFLLIWNTSVSILPNSLLKVNSVDLQVQTTIKHDEAYFLWKNKPLIENKITYQKGFEEKSRYLNYKTLDKSEIDSLLLAGNRIYCDYPNKESLFSRENLLKGNKVNELLLNYDLVPVDSFQNLYGKNYIYLIR